MPACSDCTITSSRKLRRRIRRPAAGPRESATPRSRSSTMTAGPFASRCRCRASRSTATSTPWFSSATSPSRSLRRDRMALLNLVADRTNRAVVVTDRNLGIVYSNAAFAGLFGYSPEDAIGTADQPVARRPAYRHARRWRGCDAGSPRDTKAKKKSSPTTRTAMKSGSRSSAKAFRDERGRIKYLFALLTDITETRQLRSLQQLIMGALADEVPITEIFDRLCRRVEVIAPDVVSSVLHVDADGLIHPLGGPSLPAEYSRALDGIAIGPDIGSCGSAAYFGKAVLADNIDTDPRWQPFKAMPLAAGLKACWSTPIKAKDGRVIGTFAFYFRECRAPSRWHQRIVDACVHLGALAIERKEARAQIARLAYHDMLTGLPNRAQLRQLIDQAIEGCPDGQQRRAAVPRSRSFQGRQRYARTLGRRRVAGRTDAASARADSAGRHAGTPGRRRVRDRAAELRSGQGLADRLRALPRRWPRRCGSATGRCRSPPAWASASIRTTPPTSIR